MQQDKFDMPKLMMIAIRKRPIFIRENIRFKKRTIVINIELLEYFFYLFDDPQMEALNNIVYVKDFSCMVHSMFNHYFQRGYSIICNSLYNRNIRLLLKKYFCFLSSLRIYSAGQIVRLSFYVRLLRRGQYNYLRKFYFQPYFVFLFFQKNNLYL